jgi:dynein heavy chain, axonemal
MLGDMKFLESLKEYDKDNIPSSIMTKIRSNYLTNPDFRPELMKNISSASLGICKWIIAISNYDKIIKIVAPKQARLTRAQNVLNDQMVNLNKKQNDLKSITDKLQSLNDKLDIKQIEQRVNN